MTGDHVAAEESGADAADGQPVDDVDVGFGLGPAGDAEISVHGDIGIQVENIDGSVLLISSDDDGMWDSRGTSERSTAATGIGEVGRHRRFRSRPRATAGGQ